VKGHSVFVIQIKIGKTNIKMKKNLNMFQKGVRVDVAKSLLAN